MDRVKQLINRSPMPEVETKAWEALQNGANQVFVDPITLLSLIREVEANRKRKWFMEEYEVARAYETAMEVHFPNLREDKRWEELP